MKEYPHSLSEQGQMRPLIELINEAYWGVKSGLPYDSVQDFITSDTKSTEFIRVILQDDEFEMPDKGSELYDLAKARARHSAITFLLGLTLFRYEDFEKMILDSSYVQKADGHNAAIRLWMLTALYHDYGYALTDINNGEVDHKSKIKYYLLDDSYPGEQQKILQQFSIYHKDAFAYTYDEIEKYDQCSRRFSWREQRKEKVDHGILGGIRIFDRLIKRIIKKSPRSRRELLIIKASCLTIAQHNIFKSGSPKDDKNYGDALQKLHSTSKFVIDQSTPLLLLLSLVDTFECVKKLSKGENETKYLETISVLSLITLSVSREELIIDFSKLEKRLRDKKSDELNRIYNDYKKNLWNLTHWTSFITSESDNGMIKIRMNTAERLSSQNTLEATNKEFAYT